MKKQLLFAVLFACTALYVTSCKKDKTNTPAPASTMNNAKDFVKKHGMQKQEFPFNSSELPKTFTLNEGTQITIFPGSLTMNGYPVTGDFVLEAFEIRKRSDAIFTGTNTNHITGAPLVSDGFFYLDIKKDGVSVDPELAVNYDVKVPTTREGEFTNIWEGDIDANGTGQMGWQDDPLVIDSVKGMTGLFNFAARGIGWLNCDVFYNMNVPKTTVTVSVPNNPGEIATFMGDGGNTFIIFCPEGQNVVAQLYTPAGTNTVKSYDNVMPVGSVGKLIAFSIKDGKFWFAKQDVTITANMSATLILAETTEAAIVAEIDALDID